MNKSINNEYIKIVNHVQDYIANNLARVLTLEELASVASVSPFYFHRLFSYITNESLYNYIKRNRLEKAIFLLQSHSSLPISQIALDVGFANQSSFAKAFKIAYGVSASQYRRANTLVSTPVNHSSSHTKINGIEPLWISIVDLPEMELAYIRNIGSYKGDTGLFRQLFSRLYTRLTQSKVTYDNSSCYCLYHSIDDITVDARQMLSVCVEVASTAQLPDTISKMSFAPSKYAIGRFVLTEHDYTGAWNYMLFSWLSASGYIFSDSLPYERYTSNICVTTTGKHIVDICIPIKKARLEKY